MLCERSLTIQRPDAIVSQHSCKSQIQNAPQDEQASSVSSLQNIIFALQVHLVFLLEADATMSSRMPVLRLTSIASAVSTGAATHEAWAVFEV
jgi:hypothetical protein